MNDLFNTVEIKSSCFGPSGLKDGDYYIRY